MHRVITNSKLAKPFLKWAGGKSQLINQFVFLFPEELKRGEIKNYCEPFLGSGAVFFYIAQNYPIEKAILSDINEEIVLTFNVVKKNTKELIQRLKGLKKEFLKLDDSKRKTFYYNLREEFNESKKLIDFNNFSSKWIDRAAQVIFLNKTCYNGLFRFNKEGGFNVPYGRYSNPSIFSEENLINASQVLQIAEIIRIDFENITNYLKGKFFIYFDPPYRPLNNTSNFTSYDKTDFTDKDQIRLAKFFKLLSEKGHKLMLSNSDPKNINPDDNFFDDLYKEFNIHRVKALRVINSKSERRGAINELVITNY